jgi:eukaryotic-like serine/threonine-protein kinase
VSTVRDQLQRTLGSAYVLDREVGRGGMATVYLARDVKHDRPVALKVLDPELGAVLGAERFLSEIRVTANLQHPNLLPLFDSGEAEGLLYYVMPYVEGESLRHRLDREKQLPVDEAVRITVAVANALDYAHQHGVIHRDLKPENILLQHGQPVVADFGIALAVSNAGGARVTQTGLSLGTPQYMSPEQATGDRVIDGRTDIYSLGAVAYEMLAGEPPHSGTSAQAIIAKLMTTEPQPLHMLRPSVPPNVAMAVEQALAKLPADRFASAQAFADALSNPRFTTTLRSAATAQSARKRRGVELAMGAIAGVSLLAAGWAWARPAPTLRASRYDIALDSSEAMVPTPRWGRVAISPDGSTIVYVGPKKGLMVRRRDELHAKEIPGAEAAGSPFFSPDGKHIGFFQHASRLMIVGFDGNPPVFVTDSLIGLAGGAWGPDDMLYVDGLGTVPLVRVAARANAKPEWFGVLDTAAGERDEVLPNVLPDGKAVLFTAQIRSRDGTSRQAIEIADRSGDHHRLLVDHALMARYAAPGYLVYVTDASALMAVPFDARARKITGSAVMLADHLSSEFNALEMTVSQDGTLLYVSGGSAAMGRDLVWVARDGKETPLDSSWHNSISDPVISPDGKLLAVTSGISLPDVPADRLSNTSPSGETADIWIRRLGDGLTTRLSVEGGDNRLPAWSADGKSVLYSVASVARGTGSIVEKRTDGAAPPVIRARADRPVSAISESPDGQWLLYQEGVSTLSARIVARRRGDSTSVPLFRGSGSTKPAVSPDGKWLAFVSTEQTGASEVYVVPFPNVSAAKWQVSRAGGDDPHWSNRGDEIVYRDSDRFLVSVPVSTKPTFSSGTPKRLFSTARYLAGFALEHDDLRFLMVHSTGTESHERLSVYENWIERMRQK